MSRPENHFEYDLHQRFLTSMEDAGYISHTLYDRTPKSVVYGAIFIPSEEYIAKLDEYNGRAYAEWTNLQIEEHGYFRVCDFEETRRLPNDLLLFDERFVTSHTAWDALAKASELAAKAWDQAPPEEYFELSDTTNRS